MEKLSLFNLKIATASFVSLFVGYNETYASEPPPILRYYYPVHTQKHEFECNSFSGGIKFSWRFPADQNTKIHEVFFNQKKVEISANVYNAIAFMKTPMNITAECTDETSTIGVVIGGSSNIAHFPSIRLYLKITEKTLFLEEAVCITLAGETETPPGAPEICTIETPWQRPR